jgi:ketosteroid isomerase-like protein
VRKRLKGLEPSTFCMASRRSSQLSYSRAVVDSSFEEPEWRPFGARYSRTMARENVELIRGLYGIGEAMSLDELLAALPELIQRLADPEIEWVEAPNRIDRRTYRGHEGVRRAIQHWLEDFEEYRYELREIIDCGDDVLVIAHEEGRGAASGAAVTAESYQLFTVRDGKIRRFRGFSDRRSAFEAAGL